jgi:tetratricopeptide (TPR) repeat protein
MALEAVELYEQTEAMYRKLLSSDDLRFAGLYNNMSLAYQALSDWSHAEACLHQALDILERRGDHKAEAAITHSNLAVLFLRQREYDQAERHLHRSLAAFDEAGGKNVHRPAALAGLAQLYYYKQDFDQSVDTYLAALKEIEANFGRNRDYVVTSRSAAAACRAAGKDGLAAELEEQALAAEKALGGE